MVKLEGKKGDKYLPGTDMRQKEGLQNNSWEIFRVMGIVLIFIVIVFTLLYIFVKTLNSSFKIGEFLMYIIPLDSWKRRVKC